MICCFGRGHGGTRAIAKTLLDSGVFMGATLNESYDLIPAGLLYEACWECNRHVKRVGDYEWDFTPLLESEPSDKFRVIIHAYLRSVLKHKEPRGFKIPELSLCLPWFVKLYPEAAYIHWVRDPRDVIAGPHIADDIRALGVDTDEYADIIQMRAVSWLYHVKIALATPKPARWLRVRFEDFVLNQDEELARISDFVGVDLVRIAVEPGAVNRWQRRDYGEKMLEWYPFLRETMEELGYA